jgi:hypothetical protein
MDSFKSATLTFIAPRAESRATHLGVRSSAERDSLVTSVEMGVEPTQESVDICEGLPVSLLAYINFGSHKEGTTYNPVG